MFSDNDKKKQADLNSKKIEKKTELAMNMKEAFLEEYEDSGLDHNNEYEFEFILPSLESKILTDESDLCENIYRLNDKIKHERETCLKLLTDINENKDIELEKIFDDLSRTLSINRLNIPSGENLKKFIYQNFVL